MLVYRKSGIIPTIARWFHERSKHRFWFNLAYGEVETDDSTTPIGVALNDVPKGGLVTIMSNYEINLGDQPSTHRIGFGDIYTVNTND